MTAYRRWLDRATKAGLAGILIGMGLAGCGKKNAATSDSVEGQDAPVLSISSSAARTLDPRLQQSFAEATLAEPPQGVSRPPEVTFTDKSVGKLYTDVVQRWDQVKFFSPAGKRLGCTAAIDTDLGTILVVLWPEIAPNHVRNFIALAQAGYYDGLVFERTVHEDADGSDARIEMIEGGSPRGIGGIGDGSIGYWLRPELSEKTTHEEGVLGACRVAEDDTSACPFYINLCKAPYLDGQYTLFGKVTQGLDIARKILSLPVSNDPEGDRPVKPVAIRHIKIEMHETEDVATAE